MKKLKLQAQVNLSSSTDYSKHLVTVTESGHTHSSDQCECRSLEVARDLSLARTRAANLPTPFMTLPVYVKIRREHLGVLVKAPNVGGWEERLLRTRAQTSRN